MSCPGRACTRIRTSSSSVPWKTDQLSDPSNWTDAVVLWLCQTKMHCVFCSSLRSTYSQWHLKQPESILSCHSAGKCESEVTDPLHRVNPGWVDLTTTKIHKRPKLTSSDSRSSSVSSTWTTASAPHGIGAPVVTLITWPGITVWVGCTETQTGWNTWLKLKFNDRKTLLQSNLQASDKVRTQ